MRKHVKLSTALALLLLLFMATVSAFAIEYAIFPMAYMKVTQGMNTGSHVGKQAIDLGGKNTGIDNFFAPFAGKIVYRVTGDGSVILQSLNKVKYANGVEDYMFIWLAHDNDISNLKIGTTVAQGAVFYQEGNKGRSGGNHVHMEVGRGKYVKGETFVQYTAGGEPKTRLKTAINPSSAFFVDPARTKILNAGGFTWKTLPNQDGSSTGKLEDLAVVSASELSADGKKATIGFTFKDGAYQSNVSIKIYLRPAEQAQYGEPKVENASAAFQTAFYPLGKRESGKTPWTDGQDLLPGTTYCYKFAARIGGVDYLSQEYSFTTKGSKPATPVPAPTATPTQAPTDPPVVTPAPLYGDANADQDITVQDVLEIINYLVANSPCQDMDLADANRDGVVDLADLAIVLDKVVAVN